MTSRLAYQNSWKEPVRFGFYRVIDLTLAIRQRVERKPEGILNLVVERKRTGIARVEDECGDCEMAEWHGQAGQVVQAAEKLRSGERYSNFLEGLALRGRAEGRVGDIYATAREGHLARPGVARSPRALDQEQIQGTRVVGQHDRHRRPMLQFTFMQRGLVPEQSSPNIVNTQHPQNIPKTKPPTTSQDTSPRKRKCPNPKQPGQLGPRQC